MSTVSRRQASPIARMRQRVVLADYCRLGLSLLGPHYAGVDFVGAALTAKMMVASSLRRIRG